MSSIQKTILTYSVLAIVLLASCSESNKCKDVMCTMEIRSVQLAVLNSNATPYLADAVKIYDMTNMTLWKIINPGTTNGIYTIISDGDNSININENKALKIDIIKNNTVVASTNYLINRDCCHVGKLNGDDTLIIQ